MRLDRYLQLNTEHSLRQVRQFIVAGQVEAGGRVTKDPALVISRFTKVVLNGQVLRETEPCYLMLFKPEGVVSATEHDEHRTVLDLVPPELRSGLHIAGRLDLKTTGLLILTNDGHWSRRITQPESKIGKVYRVETKDPVHPDTEQVFAEGIYFGYEDITTSPAEVARLSSHQVRLTIFEGRYHQVKRMFGHFDNEVIALHREQIGDLKLDTTLKPGEFRPLTPAEIELF